MMRKFLLAAAICAAVVAGSSAAAVANFDVGVAAYDRGDCLTSAPLGHIEGFA